MAEPIRVLIGIQARSSSTRLPNKCFEVLDGKPLIDHVFDRCEGSAGYINRNAKYQRVTARVVGLIPEGDDTLEKHLRVTGRQFITGDLNNVLSRYWKAQNLYDPDYIVRITADCPLMPPYLITKHIQVATTNAKDYVSNVDERVRITLDGNDCEIISRKAMRWLYDNASLPSDLEHVTTLLRRAPPLWLEVGHVLGHLDMFNKIKLSVDTNEDLECVRREYARIKEVTAKCEELHGKKSVFHF